MKIASRTSVEDSSFKIRHRIGATSALALKDGILSSLLFSIIINLITDHNRCSYRYLHYADDLLLHSQARMEDISPAIDNINGDLKFIKYWLMRFGLSVNPTKCHAILLGSKNYDK